MNRPNTTATGWIEHYLSRLGSSLQSLPQPEREDILQEIRAHIMDSAGPAPDAAAIQQVLRTLGAPEELGERYHTEFVLARASRSFAPWVLMRTAGRWAMVSLRGFTAFFIGFVGYSLGIVLYITALLKPLVPQIGLWVGRGTVEIGTPGSQAGLHEVLGPYYIVVAFIAGFGAFLGTTQALRWLMRRRQVLGITP
jgi:hypothetical protein